MKKELPPAAIAAIAIVTLVLVIGGGMMFVNRATGSTEDPELVQKQLEFERSKRPGGGAEPTELTRSDSAAPQGYSPGREAEMEARKKTQQGN